MEGEMTFDDVKSVYYASGSTIASFPTENSSHLFFANLKDQSKQCAEASWLDGYHALKCRCGGSFRS